jgi:DNA polymerase-4
VSGHPVVPAAAPPRRTTPSILHVDMDAFFASVEVLCDPSLAGRPVVVGGTGQRGVVASCTYEARAYGVRSAMPVARARQLCPHAVFLPGRYDTYAAFSRRVFDVFRSFTPLVEGVSLDEAFLDVAGARRLFGEPEAIARAVRRRVRDETGLWCSVGAAAVKFVAKLASEAAKPRPSPRGAIPGPGVVVVAPGEELAFLHPLPVRALWGVGPATLAKLERLGLRTVGDLAALPLGALVAAVGEAHGRHLHDLAHGRDDRGVVPDAPPKSVGHEETFATDHRDADALAVEAVRLADAVAARLRERHLAGRTVTVKVRFGDFRTITRSRTLPVAIDTGPELARVARELLRTVDPAPGVRLLGVSVSNLAAGSPRQLPLDGGGAVWPAVAEAVDRVRARFGLEALGPASLAGRRAKRRGDQQWGPEADR